MKIHSIRSNVSRPRGSSQSAASLRRRSRGSRRSGFAFSIALVGLIVGCSGGSDDPSPQIDSTGAPASRPAQPSDASGDGTTITLLAYDSFVAPASLADFTASTGIKVEIAKGGDTGTLVNKAILTAGNPEGDVLWGLDSTLLSRALSNDLFDPYLAGQASLSDESLGLVPEGEVTPVNTSDVCLNVDLGWFAAQGLAIPESLADLSDPAYADLLVVENPATSSPGLAFLLATVAELGPDRFTDYWAALRANGVLVVDSWDAAYFTEFSAGGGGGTRPIVVSYASSPPFGVVDGMATTASVDASCYRIVEFAGVLRGTEHPAEARQLIDFMVTAKFQSELPDTNFVYPVRTSTPLPPLFEEFGKPAPAPLMVPPADIDANREKWIEQWTETVIG